MVSMGDCLDMSQCPYSLKPPPFSTIVMAIGFLLGLVIGYLANQ